jgi:hypothetical protein
MPNKCIYIYFCHYQLCLLSWKNCALDFPKYYDGVKVNRSQVQFVVAHSHTTGTYLLMILGKRVCTMATSSHLSFHRLYFTREQLQ